MGRLSPTLTLLALLCLGAPTLAQADMELEEVRALVRSGQALPLEQLLKVIEQQQAGRAVEAELERKEGRLVYEVEWLDPQGRVWEYRLDARSGEILQRERD